MPRSNIKRGLAPSRVPVLRCKTALRRGACPLFEPRNVAALSLVLIVFAGCGPKARDIAPVSGKVTLDGKPLANANVAFIPQATAGTVGHVTSRGRTDAQGKYTLKTAETSPRDGAVVGKHRVQISTKVSDATAEFTEDQGGKTAVERVPAKYNTHTELTREVPPEGSSDMNFDLPK